MAMGKNKNNKTKKQIERCAQVRVEWRFPKQGETFGGAEKWYCVLYSEKSKSAQYSLAGQGFLKGAYHSEATC